MTRAYFVALIAGILLAACGATSGSSDPDTNAPLATVPAEYAGKTNPYGVEAASQGADIFQTNCEMCHGPQGHGDGPAGQSLEPKPRNLAELQKQVSDDYLFWRINEGKPGTAMIAWKGTLSENQIWEIVAFIRSLP